MSDKHGVAHHGEPILSQESFLLCQQMALWIDTARKAGGNMLGRDWLPSAADIIKSRLFWRIRSGKRPLDHPPPRAYSCPWYEVVEEDRPHWAYEISDSPLSHEKGMVYIAQCAYKVLEYGEDGKATVVGFGPYKFKVWMGKSPYSNDHEGLWMQLIKTGAKG